MPRPGLRSVVAGVRATMAMSWADADETAMGASARPFPGSRRRRNNQNNARSDSVSGGSASQYTTVHAARARRRRLWRVAIRAVVAMGRFMALLPRVVTLAPAEQRLLQQSWLKAIESAGFGVDEDGRPNTKPPAAGGGAASAALVVSVHNTALLRLPDVDLEMLRGASGIARFLTRCGVTVDPAHVARVLDDLRYVAGAVATLEQLCFVARRCKARFVALRGGSLNAVAAKQAGLGGPSGATPGDLGSAISHELSLSGVPAAVEPSAESPRPGSPGGGGAMTTAAGDEMADDIVAGIKHYLAFVDSSSGAGATSRRQRRGGSAQSPGRGRLNVAAFDSDEESTDDEHSDSDDDDDDDAKNELTDAMVARYIRSFFGPPPTAAAPPSQSASRYTLATPGGARTASRLGTGRDGRPSIGATPSSAQLRHARSSMIQDGAGGTPAGHHHHQQQLFETKDGTPINFEVSVMGGNPAASPPPLALGFPGSSAEHAGSPVVPALDPAWGLGGITPTPNGRRVMSKAEIVAALSTPCHGGTTMSVNPFAAGSTYGGGGAMSAQTPQSPSRLPAAALGGGAAGFEHFGGDGDSDADPFDLDDLTAAAGGGGGAGEDIGNLSSMTHAPTMRGMMIGGGAKSAAHLTPQKSSAMIGSSSPGGVSSVTGGGGQRRSRMDSLASQFSIATSGSDASGGGRRKAKHMSAVERSVALITVQLQDLSELPAPSHPDLVAVDRTMCSSTAAAVSVSAGQPPSSATPDGHQHQLSSLHAARDQRAMSSAAAAALSTGSKYIAEAFPMRTDILGRPRPYSVAEVEARVDERRKEEKRQRGGLVGDEDEDRSLAKLAGAEGRDARLRLAANRQCRAPRRQAASRAVHYCVRAVPNAPDAAARATTPNPTTPASGPSSRRPTTAAAALASAGSTHHDRHHQQVERLSRPRASTPAPVVATLPRPASVKASEQRLRERVFKRAKRPPPPSDAERSDGGVLGRARSATPASLGLRAATPAAGGSVWRQGGDGFFEGNDTTTGDGGAAPQRRDISGIPGLLQHTSLLHSARVAQIAVAERRPPPPGAPTAAHQNGLRAIAQMALRCGSAASSSKPSTSKDGATEGGMVLSVPAPAANAEAARPVGAMLAVV